MSDLKWSGKEVICFLDIFHNYPTLWDVSCPEYLDRNKKDESLKNLLLDLREAGLSATGDSLKKKIKSLRDTYRNEINKIRKSKKSGAGAEEVYKPKLVWFSAADVFWQRAVGRESSSNLETEELTQLSETDLIETHQYEDQGNEFITKDIQGPKKSKQITGTRQLPREQESNSLEQPSSSRKRPSTMQSPRLLPKAFKPTPGKKRHSRTARHSRNSTF